MEDATNKDKTVVGAGDTQTTTTPVVEEQKSEDKKAPEDTIDWKKRFEETESELNKAKFKLKEKNIAEKKAPKSDDSDDDSEDTVTDEEKIQKLVDDKVQEAQISMRADVISEELDKLSGDADEKRVIQLFYENKIVKTGYDRSSIKKDLEFAQLMANKPRLEKVTAEIQSKKTSEAATSTAGGSTGEKIASDTGSSQEFSDKDKALMAKYNLKPSDIKGN